MNEATAFALNALNLNFYRDSAARFDETRRAAWPGWREILPLLRTRRARTFLDVGCGNGRFARFLDAELGAPFVYVGIDASAPLLAAAETALLRLPDARLLRADLVLNAGAHVLPAGPFDCVVAFGLLHHIPGEARRQALLEALSARTAPGGLLALAFWDFADDPRAAAHAMPDELPLEIASDLEPGDHILRWGKQGSGLIRYCHHADEAEQARLLAGLPLLPGLSFASDGRGGRSNRYQVLERR